MADAHEGNGFMPGSDHNGGVNGFEPITHAYDAAAERTMVMPPLAGASQTSPLTSSEGPDIFAAAGAIPANAHARFHDATDFDAAGKGYDGAEKARGKRGHRVLAVLLWVLAALLLLAVAGAFGAHWYFQDKAAPGVSFGGSNVAGQNAQQLAATVQDSVTNSAVEVSDGQGHDVKASLKDLGVKVDVDATVNALLGAQGDNAFSRLNPFSRQSVPLVATVDKLALNTYLTSQFVTENDRAAASDIAFDATSKSFAVKEGKDGRAVETAPVDKAVDALIDTPGTTATVNIAYADAQMPITVATAQKAADDANARLASPIKLSNGSNGTFTIPAEQVAAWITSNADPGSGTITLSYDRQAIDSYLATELPKQLNKEMVPQQDAVDGSGKVLVTIVQGVDGVTIKDTGEVAGQVYDAISNGQPANLTVPADVTKHEVQQKQSEHRIVVDRAKQIVTVYDKNDKVLKTFDVCTGKSGNHETDLGTYYIWLTNAMQDMRGFNDDGTRYHSKDVKWVSFFNGGEGFHTATWNYSGIAKGDPSNNGSHGCVNMYEQDAEWIYKNCPKGTVVQVIGAQPTAAVR